MEFPVAPLHRAHISPACKQDHTFTIRARLFALEERQLVHAINGLWFRAIRAGGPAFGNLLVLRKPAKAR